MHLQWVNFIECKFYHSEAVAERTRKQKESPWKGAKEPTSPWVERDEESPHANMRPPASEGESLLSGGAPPPQNQDQ